ncbi:MAG: aminoacetone oxidase family FAD-binding enzyme [Lachnospiraceae bacterium]|nr:aminoacetone oxidase family FAD-binding enzyme [Lachnospiraceae bacterium]
MADRVIVAGGGASGLVAAIFAAENGARVTVIEHKDRVGKKILMTGNGRCNLTNMSDVRGKYYSSDADSLNRIYDTLVRFDAEKTRDFFRRLGLYTKEKRDGGVYPVSEQAAIVLDVLRSACDRLGVRIRTDCEVTAVKPRRTGGTVSVVQYIRADHEQNKREKKSTALQHKHKEDMLEYDRLILATGGKAAAVSGSDGSGYQLAKGLGHSIIEPLPALVQLKCEGTFFRALSGVRAQCRIRLLIDGRETASEEGELQLTDYGISGIPVFQMSRLASRAIYEGRRCEAGIDFLPYIENAENQIFDKSMDRNIRDFAHKTVEEFLSGLVHKKVAAVVCRQNGVASGATVGHTGVRKIVECIRMLADFKVKITAPNSFENAQVCCGGVPLGEVDENFMSRRHSNVYIIGELLDCDGICGGYNLQWAWATGAIAGADAALRRDRT